VNVIFRFFPYGCDFRVKVGFDMSFSSDLRRRLFHSVKQRLPGGILFDALAPRRWDFRYGPRVIALRMLRPVSIYFLGRRCIGKSRPIAKLTRDNTLLYHFSPAFNQESFFGEGAASQRRQSMADRLAGREMADASEGAPAL